MRFFQGIYGLDFLSILLLLLSSILNIWQPTRMLSLIPLFIAVYRTLSKDIYKRKNEYTKFRTGANKFLSKVGLSIPDNLATLNSTNLSQISNRLKYNLNQKKKYKTVTCPGCRKKLKLPRGRGKVIITCKTCKTEFKAKV
jgi:LSD1 subclass zinc finger protein